MQELSTYKDWQVPLVSGSQCIRAAQPAENYVGDGGGDDYDVDDDEKEVDNYVDDDVGDGEVHQLMILRRRLRMVTEMMTRQ